MGPGVVVQDVLPFSNDFYEGTHCLLKLGDQDIVASNKHRLVVRYAN